MFDHLLAIVTLGGLLGVAALMFAENIFPPIPSELIMPLAGFLAARGQMSLPGAIVAGAAGALTGALVWYGVGRWVGEARLTRWAARWGRWLTLSPPMSAARRRCSGATARPPCSSAA